MLQWTPDTIRFLTDAGEHTGYYGAIAERLRPYLIGAGHVCDAGCGLGYLSRALCAYVPHVTAIDCDPLPLSSLQGQNLQITTLCADALTHTPAEPYDAMVFCFFGHISQILPLITRCCRGNAVVLARNDTRHRFTAGQHPIGEHNFPAYVRYLDEQGIPYAAETFSLDCGQPFRTWEDAKRFFTLYRQEGDNPITDDFLRHRLTVNDNKDFPLYLKQERKIGLLCISADIVRDFIKNEVQDEYIK